jgi:hypothetical protein
MGDRVTFVFAESASTDTQPTDTVLCLYAHWIGFERHERLAYGIHQARPRWKDFSYATRICVSQIIGDEWTSEYGFGLYPALMRDAGDHHWDDRYPLTVYWGNEMVQDGGDFMPFIEYLRQHLSTELLEQYGVSAQDRVDSGEEALLSPEAYLLPGADSEVSQ